MVLILYKLHQCNPQKLIMIIYSFYLNTNQTSEVEEDEYYERVLMILKDAGAPMIKLSELLPILATVKFYT